MIQEGRKGQGGTFRLAFTGETAAAIAYNGTAAQVKSSLEERDAVSGASVMFLSFLSDGVVT